MKRALVGAVLAAVLVGGAGSGGAQQRLDFASVALNVLPPGQAGDLAIGRHSSDQAALYDGLTPQRNAVSGSDLRRYFKSARFGVEGRAERVQRPRPGVRIVRDRWGVPHVYGRTRADVEFGAGWVTAEDRGLLLQLLRNAGRIAALDVPGINAFAFALSGRAYRPSAEAEQQLSNQVALLRATADGRRLLADVQAYVAGINAYHSAQSLPIDPWTANDVAGMAALIGAVFGVGGGDETRRSMFRSALIDRLGVTKGSEVFDDLSERQNPATPVTIARPFAWEQQPAGETAAELADGSFEPVTYGVATTHTSHRLMSNALLIGRSRSATGRPLFVAGPQVGHFYPQILFEMDLHGGGIDARGASFPGVGFYVLLGRGKDYAWSLTSSTSDLVDDYAEVLCGDDTHYRYNGECREMQTFDAGTLVGVGDEPDRQLVFRTTVHGPVIGYARLRGSGERVAISRKRATRGRDVLSGLAWQDLNTNKPRNAREFLRSASRLEMSFNWYYADDRSIATFSSGRLPVRSVNIPGKLAFGTGEYEWRGFLPFARHPQAINPPSGAIVNWNNKPAPAFTAADDQWSYGSVHRVELLTRGIAARRTHTLASMVGAMNRAATQDLRGVRVLPAVEAVVGTAPKTPLAGEIFDTLVAWRRAGAPRLDADGDGLLDDRGAAVMDAAWPKLADAVMTPVLGDLTPRLAELLPRDDPLSDGNAFGAGWYGYVETDLLTILGRPVRSAYRTRFCGGGDLAACRDSLWDALDQAGRELVARHGPDRSRWLARDARIGYAPFLSRSMRGTNRPTFQQVVTFGGRRR